MSQSKNEDLYEIPKQQKLFAFDGGAKKSTDPPLTHFADEVEHLKSILQEKRQELEEVQKTHGVPFDGPIPNFIQPPESKKVAARMNSGKPKLSYFVRSFTKALEAVARVKEFGANKYTDNNWRLGGKPDDEYWDSFTRHMVLFLSGEVYDQDSGCHHIGHMVWNLCAMYELNHSDEPAIDEELFWDRMRYWALQKEKENDIPKST